MGLVVGATFSWYTFVAPGTDSSLLAFRSLWTSPSTNLALSGILFAMISGMMFPAMRARAAQLESLSRNRNLMKTREGVQNTDELASFRTAGKLWFTAAEVPMLARLIKWASLEAGLSLLFSFFQPVFQLLYIPISALLIAGYWLSVAVILMFVLKGLS